jgi:murein DD-endopeptidase MepM/ murein hydrolase activator NlpD
VQPGPGGYAAGADAAPRQSRPRTAQAKKLKPAKRGGGGFLAPSANPAADADNAMFEEAAKTQKGRSPAARRKRGGLFTEGDDEARSGSGADGRIGADTVRWPLVGELSSHYGRRGRRLHAGVDIRARYGTPIGAASAGKVEFAGRKNGYGRIVIIRHQGIKTAYAHLSSIAVDEGDYVDAGEEIGAGQLLNSAVYRREQHASWVAPNVRCLYRYTEKRHPWSRAALAPENVSDSASRPRRG